MSDALAALLALRAKPVRHVVGLLSGTSADGVDAALVEIAGAGAATRARLVAFETTPFPADLRMRLYAAEDATAAELTRLDFLLGEAFGRAALAVATRAGSQAIDLIGSHGQTICHQPPSTSTRTTTGTGAPRMGATLQIGEAAVIAELTGVPVVCDFRARDVAAGGEGAPLVPLPDFLLFHQPGRVRALQNIGGIANVTVVPDTLAGVFAFDTGPGNMALDAVTRALTGGAEAYDAGGRRAAAARIDEALLAELLAAPFFALPPPRSTGREAFGLAWLAPLLDRYAGRLDALLATLTRFTAASIHRSYVDYVYPRTPVDEVLVSGGGVHNDTIMAHLAALFAPVPVRSSAVAGVDPDAKEAIAFAILANETLHGLPGNLPAATGARGPRVLGKLVLP